ncbi:unnamed protein product [Prorocentrum cordatum]|uniref:10 kDa chaperonin n=1 Tax=Prorocentrum cordatum TaxID=2364126 RepID=A0ABN9TLP7_9DINO|nr:unnamed protein product [Polarella glacialis]
MPAAARRGSSRGLQAALLAVATGAALLGIGPAGSASFAAPARGSALPPRRRAERSARRASVLQVDGTVEPIGTHVLVRSDEPEEITKGGILLPKKESPKAGEVVAVGPGEADPDSGVMQPMSVKPGVKVMYSRYAGSDKVEFGGAEHAIIKDRERGPPYV